MSNFKQRAIGGQRVWKEVGSNVRPDKPTCPQE